MLQIVMYTKEDCPFCTKAKSLLESKGISYEEISISDAKEIRADVMGKIQGDVTVPQIFSVDSNDALDIYVGGYAELVEYLREDSEPTRRTVFNAKSNAHITGDYPLFLGEDLGFADGINVPYPILEELYDAQMGQIWNHTEVDLTQDRQDMLEVDPGTTDLMVLNLLWQTLADNVASRAIGSTLMQHVTNSSMQDLYNAIILFETIHSKTYLHIIRQTVQNPQQALQKGYDTLDVIERSGLLVETFDNLANASPQLNEEQMRELVLYCMVVLYLLESINFMASFAVTFAIAETGVFQGISQNVALVARDEILHAYSAQRVLGIMKQQWPDTWERLQPRFQEMVDSVLFDEFKWAEFLFSEGRQVVGLNERLLKDYILHMAIPVSRTLGVTLERTVEKNPLPYMDNYIDSSRVQVANQEIQNGTYLVNSVKMSPAKDISDLLSTLRSE